MKFIRWLLSNIILIAFVLALTYAYVYWDNLTGEETPLGKAIAYLSVEYDEVREFLDAYDFSEGRSDRVHEEPVAETEAEPGITETASVPQAMPLPAAQPQQAPLAMQQQPPVQTSRPQPLTAPIRQAPPVQAARPQPQTAPVRQPPVQPVRPQPPSTAMVQQAPAMQQALPAPRQPEPAPGPAEPSAKPEKSEIDVRALWISAREEYHRGNIPQSIANYQQVIENSDNNYDAYGELGNVYLSRGRYRDAADAYYQAAAILVQQGQKGRARSLLPMLERLDRARAEELNQMLSAPRS